MILLDTHVLVWWVSNPEKLSATARKTITGQANGDIILVSSISVWEIYLLVKKGRLRLTMDVDAWTEKVGTIPSVQFVPVDNSVAAKSVMLPGDLHDDPADRMIIATAMLHGVPVVTSDARIKTYPHVRTIW